MRPLWTLFSVLVAAAVAGLYVTSPIDPLQWLAGLIFDPATLRLPPAGPITRVADAALAGAAVGYVLIFIPLSFATWLDGGRQSRAFRRALAVAADDAGADPAARPGGLSSPWWPLLPLYDTDRAASAEGPEPDPLTRTGRTALIDNLIANQSAAPFFREFPVIAIGLGLVALIGQLLPVLATDPAAALAGARSGLGSATARGFCSLIAAVAAAAVFGLIFQLVGAILRRRAASICAAASLAVRRRKWLIGEAKREEANSGLLVTPVPRGLPQRIDNLDDKLIEHVAPRIPHNPAAAGRDIGESVESAIRDLQATTLRPMLQDISRLLSLLGDRAGHLVETVDDRLKLQNENIGRILDASTEIGRAVSTLPAFGERAERLVATMEERLKSEGEQTGQMLAATSEISRALAALPAFGDRVERLVAALEERLNTQLNSQLNSQGEQAGQALAATAEIGRALSAFGDRSEQVATAVVEQMKAQSEQAGQILAATSEIGRALAALAESQRSVPPLVAGTDSTDLAALQALRQTLDEERGATAETLQAIGRELTRTLDAALRGTARSIIKPVSAQTEAIRQAAERLDTTAAAMARVGTLIEQSSGTLEHKLDRMVAAQEAMPAASGGADSTRQLQEMTQDVAVVTRAAREALEAIAALSERVKLHQPGAVAAPAASLAGWPANASPPPPAAAEPAGAEPRGWAQRIRALHRSSLDMTSDLPELEPEPPLVEPMVEPVVPLADPLRADKYLENPALEDKQPG